jgi:hypothetical protein
MTLLLQILLLPLLLLLFAHPQTRAQRTSRNLSLIARLFFTTSFISVMVDEVIPRLWVLFAHVLT